MENIAYRVIPSDRRTVAIQILPDGQVLVRCPKTMDRAQVERFVQSKERWILKHLPAPGQPFEPFDRKVLKNLTQQAAERIPERVAHFAARMGVTYGRITIRRQRTRWGSCSAKGNLNFNCLLMLVPPEVLDYVVVHELCHRKQMNHSAAFWAEAERFCPDYKSCRRWLKEKGTALIARLR